MGDLANILVTGGFGFVGGHLVDRLTRQAPDARVHVVDDLSSSPIPVAALLAELGSRPNLTYTIGTVMDFHASYNLPLNLRRVQLSVFAHVFNVLDEVYVQDAVDNSSYNAYTVDGEIANPHMADAAEVYLGLERNFNAGLTITY